MERGDRLPSKMKFIEYYCDQKKVENGQKEKRETFDARDKSINMKTTKFDIDALHVSLTKKKDVSPTAGFHYLPKTKKKRVSFLSRNNFYLKYR